MPHFNGTVSIHLILLVMLALIVGCRPGPIPVVEISETKTQNTSEAEAAIASAFGSIRRDKSGKIVSVNLAEARSSATDEVLEKALTIPGLRRLRISGSGISRDCFAKLSEQTDLADLFLQDVPVSDDDLLAVLSSLQKLTRLTLRRLPNVTDKTVVSLPDTVTLSQWALIDMNITPASVQALAARKTLRAVDLRNCVNISPDDYTKLTALPRLSDLKVGGYSVNDTTLDSLAQLEHLEALTIDDAFITAKGWTRFSSSFRSRDKIDILALNRCPALLDQSMETLEKFPKLLRLTLSGMMVTGTFLDVLARDEARRPKFRRLDLRKSLLTTEGARALGRYPELRYLDLTGTALTPELAEILGTLTWLETIDVTDCQPDDASLEQLGKIKKIEGIKRP